MRPPCRKVGAVGFYIGADRTEGRGRSSHEDRPIQLVGVHIAAGAEALALAEALGLDPAVALKPGRGRGCVLMLGAIADLACCGLTTRAAPKSRAVSTSLPGDMGIVNSAARAVGLATPIAAAAEGFTSSGRPTSRARRMTPRSFAWWLRIAATRLSD